MAALGLHCCTQVFLWGGRRELLSSCGAWASHGCSLSFYRSQAKGRASFSSCGAWAQQLWLPSSRALAQQLWHETQLPRGMWIHPGPCLLHWQVDSYLLLYRGSPEKALLILNDGRLHQNCRYSLSSLYRISPLMTSLVAQMVKCLPTMQQTWVRSLDWEDPLEKEIATHSSTLAWKIPWMEERGRLQSMGSQSQTRLSNFTFTFSFGKFIYWMVAFPGDW